MNKNLKRSLAVLSTTVMLSTTATVLSERMPVDLSTYITAGAEETVTLPTTLQFGDINIVENGAVITESGETWNYDASTNTINITADTELTHSGKCIYSDKDLNINVAEGVTLKSTVTGNYPGYGAIECNENMFIGGTGTIKAISGASIQNKYGMYAGGKMQISGITLNVECNKLNNSYYAINTGTGELIIENAVVTAPHSCQSGTQTAPCPVKILGNSVVNINSGYYGLRGSEFTFSDQAHVKIKTSRPYIIGNYDTGQLVLADEHTTDYYWRTNPDSVFKDGTTSSCAGEVEYNYYYFEYIGAKHLKYTQNNDGETHKHCCIDECINTATVTESEACSGGTATCIDKAICDYCGEEYGNPLGHSLQKTEYVSPTCTEDGNIAYWHCTECNKYFSDEACTQEISPESTIIPATGFEFDEETGVLIIVSDDATTSLISSDINKKTIKRVEIQNGVTSIGDSAFYGCSSLTEITIPESVTSIGDSAFYGCSSLTEITIPESVTSISKYTFYGCSSLTEITIPESVTSIGNSAFYGCSSLTEITIPESVTSINTYAFCCCSSLTSIVIPNGVTHIGNAAFAICDKLDTMMYPDGLYVSSARIPETTTRIEYTMDVDRIIITNIILGVGKTKVELPQGVDGKEIVHEHTGGTASCNQKAICEICDTAYGEFTAHNLTKMEAVPPTCTENGNTAYWHCTECDKYFSDEACENEIKLADTVISASGHNYVDGKCTECGVFENSIGVHLKGYTLSLDGNIGVNFFMELDESVIADKTSYMQFTLPNGETPKVKVSEAVQQEVNGNTYYVFSCEVAAKEMFDKITAQIITSGKNGEVYEYSVEEYIQYIRENSSEFDEKTIRLVDAMAEYGDYTKAYFNNEKVNASPEMDAVTADTLAEFEKQTSGELPESIAYYGSSLLLESNTTMRHYFKVANGIDVSAYGFTEKDGYYYKEITGISADKLGTAQSVTVDGYTVSYSPLSYAYAVLKSDSTDESLKNLVKALYLYEQAAEAYKN